MQPSRLALEAQTGLMQSLVFAFERFGESMRGRP